MESAKNAISNFISGDGAHKTSVHQDQRGAITEEHVKPHRHEEVTTAVDKEVHQHHHRTIVQPIQHTETLPEKHTHNALPVEHKTIHHSSNDPDTTRSTLEADQARYASTSTTHDTTHSTSAAPIVAGEHVHHHVHEHVQPVIQKHVAAPEVVHTTVPIHETHHLETVHHDTKILPAKTMDEFQNANAELISKTDGGVEKLLGKHEERKIGQYDGCGSDYVEKGVKDGRIVGSENTHKHLADPTGTAATAAAAAAMTAKSGSHSDNTAATTADTMADTTRESGALGTGTTTTRGDTLARNDGLSRERGALGGGVLGTESATRGDTLGRDDNLTRGDELAREQHTAPLQDTSRTGKVDTLKETAREKAAEKSTTSNTLERDTLADTTRDSSKISESAKAQAAAEGTTTGNTLERNTPADTTRDSTKISESAEAQAAAEKKAALNKDSDYTTSGTERTSLDTGKYDISSRVPRDPTVSDKDKGLLYDEEKKRVSLKDKLNPFKDADGDGKKGIFS